MNPWWIVVIWLIEFICESFVKDQLFKRPFFWVVKDRLQISTRISSSLSLCSFCKELKSQCVLICFTFNSDELSWISEVELRLKAGEIYLRWMSIWDKWEVLIHEGSQFFESLIWINKDSKLVWRVVELGELSCFFWKIFCWENWSPLLSKTSLMSENLINGIDILVFVFFVLILFLFNLRKLLLDYFLCESIVHSSQKVCKFLWRK